MDKLALHPRTEEGLNRVINSGVHAVGIEGQDGSGKRPLADKLAGEIMQTSDIAISPYILTLDCEAKAGIEEIREIIRFLSLKIPGNNRYKRCLIFYSFEKLSHEGQNSLLKSLEEPPEDTMIIITARTKSLLLPTIVSRLTWLSVLPLSRDEAMDYFQPLYEREKIANAYLIAEGRVGMMGELLENYDGHPLTLSIAKAKEIIKMDRFERLAAVESIAKSEENDTETYLWALAKVLRAAASSQAEKTGTISKRLLHNLKLVASAQNTQKYNSNQKAVLTELFYGL